MKGERGKFWRGRSGSWGIEHRCAEEGIEGYVGRGGGVGEYVGGQM